MDVEKEYKRMISKIKEISLEFTDNMGKACVPAVLRSITKKTSQHLKESISVQHHVQTRFDPYLNVDEDWDDSTEELVTELFKLAGDASSTLTEMHYRIAILWSKVRPETFLKLINAIPLPNTDLTVIQRAEPQLGLNVDEERIQDHMPRPTKLDGIDIDTKLLGTLVHWVMCNNLLTRVNTYSAKQASKDFDVSYTKLKRVIYACSYCTQPFNQYSEYLEHLGEHKDKVIRCRLCNKEIKTITRLRRHTKSHVNQCPLFSVNFLTPQALQDHVKESYGSNPATVERQCSLCEFTCNSMSELSEHSQNVHRPYICFLHFSAEYKLAEHRLAEHKISSLGVSVEVGDQGAGTTAT